MADFVDEGDADLACPMGQGIVPRAERRLCGRIADPLSARRPEDLVALKELAFGSGDRLINAWGLLEGGWHLNSIKAKAARMTSGRGLKARMITGAIARSVRRIG